jgi:hypothetical protein
VWLEAPTYISDVLQESQLDLDESSLARLRRGAAAGPLTGEPQAELARSLPVVSIGEPETWPLSALYDVDAMPPMIRASMKDADFYLVRLACSFRPVHRESQIEWARLAIELHQDEEGRQPIAEAQHPVEVNQEIQRHTKFTLSPSLTFQPVEVSVGEIAFGFDYPELRPMISAAGYRTSKPNWDYFAVSGSAVQGGKWMHLLVKTPRGTSAVHADLSLAADVRTKGAIVRAVLRNNRAREAACLRTRLWG